MKPRLRPQAIPAADGDDALSGLPGGQGHQALGIHLGNGGIRGFIGQVRDPEPLLPVVLALGVDLESAVLVDHKSDLAIAPALAGGLFRIAPFLGHLRLQGQCPDQNGDDFHRQLGSAL